MSRFVWLTACLAVLFGLQGPLCAAACLAEAAPDAVASAPEPAMPCHEPESAPGPLSSEPEEVCGCAGGLVAIAGADVAIDTRGEGATPLPAPVLAWRPNSLAERPAAAGAGRLPPPDILLQSSTLLL